ncbi:RNA polymerase sigma factor [Robertkochia solimangrovi]|uniref:RNA polymerase sigma factor n=1 Tax=Robertkochia solimangrovi TaxID=2213046 RepID=UPI0013A590CC|nr:sigma-70 family RNA polymerase sigma factor [Robertkochia solimangrovi]
MQLLNSLKDGDLKALETVYLKYHQRLYHLAKYFVKDDSSASDIVHDIILKLYHHRNKLSTEVTLEAQLIRIAKSYCIDFVKKQYKTILTEVILEDREEIGTDSDYNFTLKKELLNQAIEILPTECKEIFKLHKLEGLTQKEIANYKSISIKTVENQISKAVKILKEQLQKPNDLHYSY